MAGNDLVKNAADPKQVGRGERLERDAREQELTDLREVMNTPAGRRFMWRLLGHCKTFGSIWSRDAMIHYNAGQQDIGHFLIAEITEAAEEKLLHMMMEAGAAKKFQRQQTEGERTPSAEEMNDGGRRDEA